MAASAPAPRAHARFDVLDGFRAISILLVLGTHMLPMGPKVLELNEMSGFMGMALFFTLSGFLITYQLNQRHNVPSFFIRRLFRIVPLAYVTIFFTVWLTGADVQKLFTSLAFVQNYLTDGRMVELMHFWSLCVEMHFYVFIGLLMWVTRFRGFMVLPFVWLAMVVSRSIVDPRGVMLTHVRVDEILSGCLLALTYLGKFGDRPRAIITRVPFVVWCLLLVLTSHPLTPAPLHALRGLVASSLVGHALFSDRPERFRLLGTKPLRYVAEVSYALYVIHPLSMHGWLGTGETPVIKYAKRLVSFAITFGLAHLSTFYFEQRFIDWGKALCKRIEQKPAPLPAATADSSAV
jgi:peptidoglycan/LPS O-acetylase OafA/YrhL